MRAAAIRGECAVIVNRESEHAEFITLNPMLYIVVDSAAACVARKSDSSCTLKVVLISGDRTVAAADPAMRSDLP